MACPTDEQIRVRAHQLWEQRQASPKVVKTIFGTKRNGSYRNRKRNPTCRMPLARTASIFGVNR